MNFTALKDFFSDELKSGYVRGMTYSARSPEALNVQGDTPFLKLTRANRAKLLELLPVWVEEGKVALGTPAGGLLSAASGSVRGTGEVSG